MSAPPARHRGHALLIMLAILVMGSVVSLVGQLDGVYAREQQLQRTDAALALAKEALLAYALTYRDDDEHADEMFGYLPCPDTSGKGGVFTPGDGTATGSCGSAGATVVGLLPYVTLRLPDLRDASGNCLWYAVSGSFKNSPKAATPMNWDAQAQLSVHAADGTVLVTPDDAQGGAAAVIFAPGLALGTQTRGVIDQRCRADPAEAAAYLESAAPDFVRGDRQDAVGNATNNDRLTWLTPRDIFSRLVARADFRNRLAGIPPGQLNRLIDAQRKALDGRLWAALATFTAATAGTPATNAQPKNAADYEQFAGKRVGDLPDLTPLRYAGKVFDNDHANWQDQFSYVVCDDIKPITGCLTLGAQSCRGALFFAGQSISGGPRPSNQKPTAPPPSRSTWLANYFEAGAALDLLRGPATSFAGPGEYADAIRSADVGVCLSPGAYVTSAQHLAATVPIVSSPAEPAAAIDLAAAALLLGNPAATQAGSGCLWFPLAVPFTSSLRAYFKMRIADLGEGYVFALVDGANNATALHNGTLCGGSTGAHLGYASAAIARPKFGLEFDTRAQQTNTCSGGNRNDPRPDHMAFVYWGEADVATDDNCHGAGTPGSGAQPLNPRTLGTGAAIKTVQASDPRLPGDGTFPLDTDIHVRLEVDKRFDDRLVRAAKWVPASATVSIATLTAHGFIDGQRVTLGGINPPAYDGTVSIAVDDATHFSYALAADPGSYVAGGHISAPTDGIVSTMVWGAGRVTVTTVAAHGLVNGQPVSLAGATPVGYNGTYPVSIDNATAFSFALATDPGVHVAGGSLTPAIMLGLRAYVASQLPPVGGSYTEPCSAAQLRDLAVNLSDLCTQTPTLSHNDVAIDVDAISGQALDHVYAGFTGAQSSGAAGVQSVAIYNFLLKSQ